MTINEYIKGIFTGVLVACLFMLMFPAPKSCQIELTKGQITHVYVGNYVD